MKEMRKHIIGTNLGNWLVLEKWMLPSMFDGCDAEDEVWLNRRMDREELQKRLKEHRSTYVTKEDFAFIAAHGMNTVRIPVPYFLFGDCPPFLGCVEYLDLAFDWAEKENLQILIDLHTVPGGQNGYDNGGNCGVCNWRNYPDRVEFVFTVLERLARRYGNRQGLFGIEVLNEPISLPVYLSSPTYGKAVDKEEAKGSGYVPVKFLKWFYTECYQRLRKILPDEKAIVFHDGFRMGAWNRFFQKSGMKNVFLDVHIYIFAMENFVPVHKPWAYRIYLAIDRLRIRHAQRAVPVLVGEWCISTKYAALCTGEERKRHFREIAELELKAWEESAGWFFWNYQLQRDPNEPEKEPWKEGWNLHRCLLQGWMPKHLKS